MANLIKRWRQSFAVKPMKDSLDPLETWFQSALGKAILSDEQKHIDEAVADLYGFHLLQLGVNRDLNLSRNSSIQHRFSLFPVYKKPMDESLVEEQSASNSSPNNLHSNNPHSNKPVSV